MLSTALLVAPLTANTLNKWAAAISDTLALGLITEGIGLQLPIVALPHWNDAQQAHPAVARSGRRTPDPGDGVHAIPASSHTRSRRRHTHGWRAAPELADAPRRSAASPL
ncbi:flavoprotein [Streptomyces inhibens]|uniref:flavoprotein n=1 Tax=Streptomyces inhibens TaxID=2293571 RepID=UPI00402A619D